MSTRWVGLLSLLLLACGDTRRLSDAGPVGPQPDSGAGAAIAEQFCVDRSFWLCRRDEFAGRIDSATAEACYSSIESTCAGFEWPAGCRPTIVETDACITLLQRADLIDVTNEALLSMYDECNICP